MVISRNSDSNLKPRSFYSSGAVTAVDDIETTRIGKKPDSHHCTAANDDGDVFGRRDRRIPKNCWVV